MYYFSYQKTDSTATTMGTTDMQDCAEMPIEYVCW